MKRSIVETILGAVVLLVAGYFLAYGYKQADAGHAGGGYAVSADFSGIGGLKPGDDVLISGVKVGSVSTVELMPDTYLARVHMNLEPGIKLPVDTAALISSESLLGGRYLALEPGADEELIPSGGRVQFTQAPQNLEQLLGQFIFTMQDEKGQDEKGGAPASEAAPVAHEPVPAEEHAPESAPESETP